MTRVLEVLGSEAIDGKEGHRDEAKKNGGGA